MTTATDAVGGHSATGWPKAEIVQTEAPRPVGPAGMTAVGSQLVFVIPVFNEEENLPRLLEEFEARPWLWTFGSRLILVDDGSHDRTPEIAREYAGSVPLELVQLEHNQGPGAAFRAGFEAALATVLEDGFIVTLEGDTTSDLDALPAMLARAVGGADLVLASWRMVNVSRGRRLLSAGAGFVVRHALGLEAHTVSSFFRVYRATALRAAAQHYGGRLIEEQGFACKAELLAKLARMGMQVEEVPVRLDWGRRAGKSKMPVGRTMMGYWRMLLRSRSAGEIAGG